MALPKRTRQTADPLKQIAALKKRVAHLEAQLRRKPRRRKVNKVWANFEKKRAAYAVRDKAMQEYRSKERELEYRSNPDRLRIAWELEQKENAFLKSKGLKPSPSIIPASLRRQAKLLAAKTPSPR
jgi:hypothetical protein